MAKILSKNTETTYNNAIEKLKKDYKIDLDNFDLVKLDEELKEKKVPNSTQNIYYCAILYYYNKHYNINNDEKITNIRNIIKKNNEKIIKYSKSHTPSEKEKDNYTSWDTILKIYDKIGKMESVETNERISLDHLLLSLYILHPPRRTDYVNMYINDDIEIDLNCGKILWTNPKSIEKYKPYEFEKVVNVNKSDNINSNIGDDGENDDTKDVDDGVEIISEHQRKNYYVEKNNMAFFIFENYKSYQTYQTQRIEVDEKLKQIIQKFIKNNKLKKGDKLISIHHNAYIKRLGDIFEHFIKKRISVCMLRHIYISHVCL